MTQQIALVTGANRGLGFEVCRQLGQQGLTVVLTSRDEAKGQAAAETLQNEGLDIHYRPLDVADFDSIAAIPAYLQTTFGRLDVLVNNAAILYDTWQRAIDVDLAVVQQVLDTNTLGAWRLAQVCIPLMRANGYGRIVNVSSESGSLASMGGGTPAYSLSKAGLNAVTRLLAGELRGSGILVNSVCPGWVATDMGGGGRPIPEGARGIVWAAILPDDGPTGGFFRDGKPLAW
ncbi:MAG TPA: SDR family oxidoreductase [Anaerolineae bacterium]|nr:SDR family oxidoreductase [Anaerolineae bacterium]HMR62963.1 SDR family oxidoreductase [Anaerolineae bacterium]